MINPHEISKKIKRFFKWLIITNYGRFVLGALLAVTGVFSQYGTIEFLTTDWLIFEITAAAGVVLIVLQFLWVVVKSIYLYFTNSK